MATQMQRASCTYQEHGVVKDASERIEFAVNLAGVNLIEELHQDKDVENHAEVC